MVRVCRLGLDVRMHCAAASLFFREILEIQMRTRCCNSGVSRAFIERFQRGNDLVNGLAKCKFCVRHFFLLLLFNTQLLFRLALLVELPEARQKKPSQEATAARVRNAEGSRQL